MAKILYLVRHAKSSWSDLSLGDFDRPLNKRGLHDAPRMGQRLNKWNVHPDLLLSSPARRARETAETIAKELRIPAEAISYNEDIYAASMTELLQIVQNIPEQYNSAMLIGHNPSMEQLVNLLSKIKIERMPTCAIAAIELDCDSWGSVGNHAGRLLDFDYPKKS